MKNGIVVVACVLGLALTGCTPQEKIAFSKAEGAYYQNVESYIIERVGGGNTPRFPKYGEEGSSVRVLAPDTYLVVSKAVFIEGQRWDPFQVVIFKNEGKWYSRDFSSNIVR